MDLFHGEKIERAVGEVVATAQQVRATAERIGMLVEHVDECVLLVRTILVAVASATKREA